MLEITGLSKHFDGVRAVNEVSLDIQRGAITSLIGPNGAGKTTLFNIICGYIRPDSGIVKFDEKDVTMLPPHRIASLGVGRTFQNLRLIDRISAIENIMMACSSHKTDGFLNVLSSISRKHEYDNRKKAEELLRFVGLEADGYSAAGSLSYGQQKLLTLACCLALDSKLMMLDEPVAGINPETILKILDLFNELKKRGVTIFFIEHNIDAVMTASDRIIVMTEGRVVADGAPNSVRDDPIVVEAYLS